MESYIFICLFIFLFFIIYLILRIFYLCLSNKNYQSIRKKVIFDHHNLLFSDGTKLPMILNITARSDVFIIFNHGFGAHLHDLKWISDFFVSKRFSILIYSRRNEGKNSNKQTHIKKNVDDCLDILEALHQKYAHKKFILIGHSLGGAIVSECLKNKRTIPLNCSFVLLNSPNNLNNLYPHNFLQKNIFAYIHFFFLFLFNKNLSPYIDHRFFSFLLLCNSYCSKDTLQNFDLFINRKEITKKQMQKYLFLHHQKIHHYSFFYFWTMFFLFRNTFKNLKKNTWSNVYVFQGEFDFLSNIKIIQKQKKELKKAKNIKFYYIKNFNHRFEIDDPKNKIIINDILKIVLKKKINFNLSSIIKA